MGNWTKYIVVEFGAYDDEIAVLIPNTMSHDFISSLFNYEKILGAGFCEITDTGEVTVFGKSDSLRIGSRRSEDPMIIKRTLRPRKEFEDTSVDYLANIFNKDGVKELEEPKEPEIDIVQEA